MQFGVCINALPLTIAMCDLSCTPLLQTLELGLLQLFFRKAISFLILEKFWRA